MAQPIILDCDPGHDDAIALVLALASPELDVKAVTSSAGNQTPDKTLRNVLRMLTLLKRTDIPVAGGAVKPLMRELIIADNVHGESGLDGPALPEPDFAPQNCTAVELMAKVLRESAEPVTLVATGPQTNVALLLNSHPELHSNIARIVIMGGAMGLGNWTPAAEFNIFVDPEAAEIVFQSGLPIVMAGLDVTHRAQIMAQDIERFRSVGNPVATTVAELLDFFMEYHKAEKWGFHGAPLHDPCTIAVATEAGNVYHGRALGWCGNTGKYTRGMTVVELLLANGKQAEYHGDGGYRLGSVCGFTGGAAGLLFCGLMPSPRPSPTGRGCKQFCFYLRLKRPTLELVVPALRTQRQHLRRINGDMVVALLTHSVPQPHYFAAVIDTVVV